MPVARYNTGATWNTPGLTYGPAAPPAGAKKHMQNLAAIRLDTTKLTAIDTAITALETALEDLLLDLSPDDIRGLVKMGDKSEAFCREAITVLAQNPGVLPANFDLAELQADLADLDALRVRLTRIRSLFEKISDTEIAITSDIMVATLEGYALIKIAGLGEGLDNLRRELGVRFQKKPKQSNTPPPTP